MKRKNILMLLVAMLMCGGFAFAQNALNNNGDNIIGTYESVQNEDHFKAKIEKLKDGSYRAQVFWIEKDRDANGNKILDTKNPDKSLRKVPCDQVVLFTGLKHNAQKQRWDGTKIYDPQRGFTAKMSAEFIDEGTLRITGTVMGLSGHFTWKKIE